MPTISDWLVSNNSTRIRVSWETTGSSILVAADIQVGYERTWFGLGGMYPIIDPDAVSVCAHVYTPIVAGDESGPRTYVGALGAPVALPDHSADVLKPADAEASFVGSVPAQEKGLIVVFHFMNQAGQVLSKSVSLNRIITSESSGNDPEDYAALVGNTVLDASVTALQRAVGGLIDQVSEETGLDKTTVTICLAIGAVVVVILIIRR